MCPIQRKEISIDVEDFNCKIAIELCWPMYVTVVTFEVEYTKSEAFAGTRETPPEPSEIEIEGINMVEIENVINFTNKQASIIDQLICNFYEESVETILLCKLEELVL